VNTSNTIAAIFLAFVAVFFVVAWRGRKLRKKEEQSAPPRQPAISALPPAPSSLRKGTTFERYSLLIKARRIYLGFYRVMALLLAAFVALVLVSEAQMADSHFSEALGVMSLLLLVSVSALAGIGAAAFRNRSARILLLRPFEEQHISRSLKAFVVRHLGRTGFVFTLSDRDFRPSTMPVVVYWLRAGPLQIAYTFVLFIVGSFLHNSRRLASVEKERHLRLLKVRLAQKFSLSFWSFLSGDAPFNIRSTDEWWQSCVHLLVQSCDIVVVDLSRVKPGMAWELDHLSAEGALKDCLFLTNEESATQAPIALAAHFSKADLPPIHVYSPAGKLHDAARYEEQFRARLQACLRPPMES